MTRRGRLESPRRVSFRRSLERIAPRAPARGCLLFAFLCLLFALLALLATLLFEFLAPTSGALEADEPAAAGCHFDRSPTLLAQAVIEGLADAVGGAECLHAEGV